MSVTILLAEFGVIGLIFAGILLYMLFRDSVRMAKLDGQAGAISAGWAGVVVVLGLSLFYKNLIASNALGYLFALGTGYVVFLTNAANALSNDSVRTEGHSVVPEHISNDRRILQRKRQ
jgi:hypothetical protein